MLDRSRQAFLALAAAVVLSFALAGAALAASNPNGRGQPGAECGEPGATVEPAGFLKGGFAIAEAHYAGSDSTASLAHANSSAAVSQYDVACFQVTSNR